MRSPAWRGRTRAGLDPANRGKCASGFAGELEASIKHSAACRPQPHIIYLHTVPSTGNVASEYLPCYPCTEYIMPMLAVRMSPT